MYKLNSIYYYLNNGRDFPAKVQVLGYIFFFFLSIKPSFGLHLEGSTLRNKPTNKAHELSKFLLVFFSLSIFLFDNQLKNNKYE